MKAFNWPSNICLLCSVVSVINFAQLSIANCTTSATSCAVSNERALAATWKRHQPSGAAGTMNADRVCTQKTCRLYIQLAFASVHDVIDGLIENPTLGPLAQFEICGFVLTFTYHCKDQRNHVILCLIVLLLSLLCNRCAFES